MSRRYHIAITVTDFNNDRVEDIEEAIYRIWPTDNHLEAGEGNDSIIVVDDNYLRCSEAEFTERLSLAVWHANLGYCKVEVEATCLENLPTNQHELSKEDYRKLVGSV